MSNDQIRNILGAGDPTYVNGTMVREYQIDPGSNSFLEFMRKDLGVGTGMGSLRDIADSNQGATSPSPLDETGDGLDATEFLEVAQDIYNAKADIRLLRDDPTRVGG
ncbi:MAG: hypothetical protein JXB05_16560 [Myxococcaceae bacterium]|nr:hypothetical protein [Myxococcaceae bacterium]